MADRPDSSAGSQPVHPDDESLTAYMVDALDAERQRTIEAHLDTCDSCVQALSAGQHRIRIAAEVAIPVPAAVRKRVGTPVHDSARPTGSAAAARQWLSTLWHLPVLIPVSVSLGVIIGLSTHLLLMPVPGTRIRAVPIIQTLRVTAAEAAVRSAPNPSASIVATLRHGTQVEIRASEREWYRVLVANGPEGWVESRAFD